MSPSAVMTQDADAIIFDCRPPILPVSIRMKGFRRNNIVVSAELLVQIAPPGEVRQADDDSFPERDAGPALLSEFSSDVGTDLEDELCHFQPLSETVSPLSPMLPSHYPAPAVL